MVKLKKQMIFLFGGIALISYLTYYFYPKADTSVNSVISTKQEQPHIQVYLKDDNQTLVPLSLSVSEEMNEEEKLILMFAYMSGKQQIKGFQPLFQKECAPQKAEINKGVANLYFDDNLKNYQKDDELKIIESITWGATQFQDVQAVRMYLNDKIMQSMPLAQTPIPELLNRDIGINHFESTNSQLHASKSMTIYYTKKVMGHSYLIPRSKRVVTNNSLEQNVSFILEDISASSELQQPLYMDQVRIKKLAIKDGVLRVSLNKNILGSNRSLKQDVYNTLVLSLLSVSDIKKVEVQVEGVKIDPDAKKSQSVTQYNLQYNEVQF